MFNFPRHGKYHHVSEAEDSKTLMSDSSILESETYTQPTRRSLSPLLVAILVVVSSTLTCVLGLCIGRRFPSHLDAICIKHVSKYCKYHPLIHSHHQTGADGWCYPAPITEDVDISYNRLQFNGSFYKENIYRQEAAPEVDAAWEALGTNCEWLKMDNASAKSTFE
jgi:Mycotoxin biosynthesis protein UstYa